MSGSRDFVALAAVVACAAAIAWFYYTGLYCSDDTRYLIGAIRIAIGEDISTGSLAERRVALLIPAALMYGLTRSIDWAIAIYPLFYVGVGVVSYVLARRFFGRRAAVVAALLALAQPTLFLYAGALTPDLASAFFLALALFFVCLMIDAEARGPRLWLAAAIGASIAMAFVLKESSAVIVVIPAVLVAVGLARKQVAVSITVAAMMVAGFGLVLLLETVLFRVAAGHWYSSVASLLAPHDFGRYVDVQGRTPLMRLRTLRVVLGPHATMLFLVAGVGSIQLLWQSLKRQLSFREAVTWWTIAGFWAWPAFYFTFGTASLSEYAPPVMQQRYYAPCVVPAVLLVVRLLESFVSAPVWKPGRLAGGLVAAGLLLLLLAAPYAERHQRGLIYGAPAKEAFIIAVADLQRRFPELPIVDTDSGWTTDLNRCRALLRSDPADGEGKLLEAIRSRSDLHGRFGYLKPTNLEGPYLLVGHGHLLSEKEPKRWVQELNKRVELGEVRAERVGVYSIARTRDLVKWRWLPRELAVRGSTADPKGEQEMATFRESEGAVLDAPHQSVEAYLITP